MVNNTKTVLAVVFCEGEHANKPSAGRRYFYFVPDYLAHVTFKPGDHAIVAAPSAPRALVRVAEVITNSLVASNTATKSIIGTVDLDAFDARKRQIKERADIVAALTRIDRERRQRIRFQEMAGDDPDAQKLLLELDRLPNFGTDDDDH